jgi:hypothetical protein
LILKKKIVGGEKNGKRPFVFIRSPLAMLEIFSHAYFKTLLEITTKKNTSSSKKKVISFFHVCFKPRRFKS